MAISYSSAIQDQIAYALANVPYSSLKTHEKDAIDNTWSSGTPGGYAGHALTKLQRFANFVTDTGVTAVPDEWLEWLVWEVVYSAATHIRQEKAGLARDKRNEARETAFTTFNRQDWYDPTGTEQWTTTLSGIRLFIVSAMVRLSPPILPEPSIVDAMVRKALYMVWNAKDWPWLRYTDTVTIAAAAGDYTPTITYASGQSPGKLLSRRPKYNGSSAATGVTELEPVDIERMTYEQARGLDDGKPQFFRLLREADNDLLWEFERGTDAAYTFRAEFLRRIPTITSSAGFNSVMTFMPTAESDLVREVAYALTLRALGRNVGESPDAMIDRAVHAAEMISDTGDQDSVAVETGIRQVMDEQRLGRWGGGLGGFV